MSEYIRKETYDMKDFQDFADSLDQEFIDTVLSETSFSMKNALSFENSILGTSFSVAMRILERYHEWLQND